VFDDNPLIASPPVEVPLKKAPLVRVIAQVRFPTILSIGESSFIASFQEKIRIQYPTLHSEQMQSWIVGPQGIEPATPSIVWRFIDKSGNWRVSLASNFVVLETTNYTSRKNFLERLKEILVATDFHIKPQLTEQLGLRYIARLVGQDINNLTDLVRPEVSGVLSSEMASYAQQAISDSLFTLPDEHSSQIHARWGRLPANTTTDTGAIEPIAEPSWILDLDMFMPFTELSAFDVDSIMFDANRFAERLYTFFRWSVTDNFLRRFGGEI
jgi:uncharacterized protein (TIGR04255 family)